MTIRYVDGKPVEAGIYLVRCDGELHVAEWDGSDHWLQLGIDYDVWQYAHSIYEIEVLKRLNLEAMVK